MPSSTYPTSGPANWSDRTLGFVETPSTLKILKEISDTDSKRAFMEDVASRSLDGHSLAEIDAYYAACPKEDIPGYPPQTPDQQHYQQSRSQRSGDSRQASEARQTGANEGRRRDSNNGDYYARQRVLNCIYAERPGLQGSGSERSSRPWSGKLHPISYLPQISTHVLTVADHPSRRENHDPHDWSWYGFPRNNNTSYEAGHTPSGNRSGGDFPRGGGYSSWRHYSASTRPPSYSGLPQGRANWGPEQNRRYLGGGYR